MRRTVNQLILEYFQNHPKQEVEHGPVVDWITEQWLQEGHETPPRDPWRGIRSLHQKGLLVKARKGVYLYDEDLILQRELEDFSPEQKAEIFARDNYRCVVCGLGQNSGVEIHADHIKPKDKGGKAITENGQTLCAKHNFFKKNHQQTETGKRMFIRLHALAKKDGDVDLENFCREILEVFEQHNINGHIVWKE
ncbi:MAG: HNH endonuclease [Armatimonadetes bacterium]|nr:HNH endonuclease [Armatimonadota bacterium]